MQWLVTAVESFAEHMRENPDGYLVVGMVFLLFAVTFTGAHVLLVVLA